VVMIISTPRRFQILFEMLTDDTIINFKKSNT
jgi:hypothetical protein